jgi:hypothetical protein
MKVMRTNKYKGVVMSVIVAFFLFGNLALTFIPIIGLKIQETEINDLKKRIEKLGG